MLRSLRQHWPEYIIEAWCLGTFMVSACVFGVILFHPSSPVSGFEFYVRNVAMAVVMGVTAVCIIRSPWGMRSGAHFNPSITLTFLRLGKIARWDAAFYIVSQFVGGLAGVFLARLALGDLLADKAVNYVATVPGKYGVGAAFLAEVIISFFMMTMILCTSNSARLARLTPYLAGAMVAIYISTESTISGTSLNPARTFASAVFAGKWTGLWIYFIAPPIAMLAAAEFFVRRRGLRDVLCAKLCHGGRSKCIFRCGIDELDKKVAEVNKKNPFPTVDGLF